MATPEGLHEIAKMQEKKRKMAVMAVSSLVLVAMVVAVGVGVNEGINGDPDDGSGMITTSSKAIQSVCQPTDYKQACVRTLERSNAHDSDSPTDLIQAAFGATVEQIKTAVANSDTIKEAENDPRTAGALEVCKQVMGYAIGDLEKSVKQMKDLDISQIDEYVDDLKTWLSGSVTFHEACMNAFENTTGDSSEKMKHLLRTSRELCSNGLAMASEVSTIVKTLDIPAMDEYVNGRKLLYSDDEIKTDLQLGGWPSWVDSTRRRILEAGGVAADGVKPDVTVGKGGKYKTIGEALKEVPLKSNKTFVIHIMEGVYAENVEVKVDMWNVVFIGDGPTKTRITGKLNFADGTPAYQTATLAVRGDQFVAKQIGIENTAGPEKHYAIALLSQSDRSVYFNCQIDGDTYTLYAVTYRQFYRDCQISGSVDFIVGDAALILQNCNLLIRAPPSSQDWTTVTAQGRSEIRVNSGTILHNCTITSDDKTYNKEKTKAFLSRPWKKYARVVVMESKLEQVIDPQGWKPFMGTFGTDTCFFAEFNNTGKGADMSQRVKWKGVRKMTLAEAETFTVSRFLMGDTWIKVTGVPYVAGITRAH